MSPTHIRAAVFSLHIWDVLLRKYSPPLKPQKSHSLSSFPQFCSAGPTKRYPLIEAWDFRFHVCNDCFTARDVPEFESDSERLIGEPELNFMIRYDLKNYTTGSEGRRIDPEKVPCVEKRHHYHSSSQHWPPSSRMVCPVLIYWFNRVLSMHRGTRAA